MNMETYNGHVRSPQDAIILFEACRIGLLPRVQRRLSEKERQSIRSGSIFVWDEREAGMRRWTDGKSWSASRVSGSFLTYREMEGKRAGSTGSSLAPPNKTPENGKVSGDDVDGEEGPDGYRYKPDGLMKQSFSITTSNGQHLHLISYFSRSHMMAHGFLQPSTDPALRHIRPTKGLYPESTVNDEESVPAVTRSPMAGASPYSIPPHAQGYPRPGPAPPPGYPYAHPHHQIHPYGIPPPMSGPPIGYGQHQYPPNGMAPCPLHHPPQNNQQCTGHHYPQRSPFPVPPAPPNFMDQRPSRTDDPITQGLPPPPHRSSQFHPGNDQSQVPYYSHPPSQPTQIQPPLTTSSHIDPRLASEAPSSIPAPPNAPSKHSSPPNQNQNQNPSPLPTHRDIPTSTPQAQENGDFQPSSANNFSLPNHLDQTANAAATAAAVLDRTSPPSAHEDSNGITTTANGTQNTLNNSSDQKQRPESLSPPGTAAEALRGGGGGGGGNEAPAADIPSQKLAFGEDKRALKALDKVFI